MNGRRLGVPRRRHWGKAAAIALTALFILGMPADASDLCPDATAACAGTSALAEDLVRRRVDRTLATNPAGERVRRLDQSSPGSATLPFALTPDGDNANFNTSLSQWGAALSAADRKKLEEAKAALGGDAALPRLVKPTQPQFDLWAKGRREQFSEIGDVSKEGDALTTYVGADYRLRRNFLVGGMIQLDDSHQTLLAAPDAVDGTAFMAGPYMAYRVTPHIVLDAKAAWGSGHETATAATTSADFSTSRMLSEARVSGNWGWDRWKLSQIGALTYLDETRSGISGETETSFDVTRLSIGPELKRQIDMGNDNSVEPFAFFRSSVDLNAGLKEPSAYNTVGGGVMLAKPDTYSIRASADYSQSTTSPDDFATGRVSVSVPTGVLGF